MALRSGAQTHATLWSSLGVVLLLFAAFSRGPIWAQGVTATLSGTVADPTGAVIPGATVTATNLANGISRTTKTNRVGIFLFSSIDSGNYSLTVVARGFETDIQNDIHLDPGDTRTLSAIRMRPGAESVSVVVNASASAVLETGERSSIITSEDLERLATEGRDVTELEKILPGSAIAFNQSGALGNSANSNVAYDPGQVTVGGGSSAYAMSGSPLNGASVRMDGINLNDPGSYSGSTQTVNTEATSEVKVEISNFGADMPNGPVVIDTVSKSGTSQMHGSLYAHARTYQLNATDALAPALGALKPDDRYIYPGATVGGPVRIPHSDFNHNNRLFYFGQAEDYAQRNVYAYNSAPEAIYHALVPTPAMLKGDFSPAQITRYLPPGAATCNSADCAVTECPNPAPKGCISYGEYANVVSVPTTGLQPGPATGPKASNGGINVNCTDSSFGTCLAGFLDPGALAMMKLLPAPNVPGGQTGPNGYNFIRNNLVNNDLWTAHGRVDFAQSERSKMFGAYTVERGLGGVPQNNYYFGSGSSGGVNTPGGSIEDTNSQSAVLNWTDVVSSTMTNEAVASIAYVNQVFKAGDASLLNNSAIGFPYLSAYSNGTKQFPTLVDYGYDGLPLGLFPDYSYGPIYMKRFTYGFGDNLTKVWGRHTLKFGVNIERAEDNSVSPGSGGVPTNGGIENYYVNPTFNLPTGPGGALQKYANSDGLTSSGTGNLLASFLEGEIMAYEQANLLPKIDLNWWETAFYATDSWKIRRNVTLTIGVRAEHQGEWQDGHHTGIPVFIPSTYATIDPTPNNPLPGFHWHAIDPDIPNSGQTVSPLFFDPRFGFSWDMRGNGRTVLGGGYGWYRFHDAWGDVANAAAVSEGQRTIFLTNPYPTGGDYTNNGLTLGYVGSLGLDPANPKVAEGSLATTGLYGFDPHDHKQPLVATYSVTFTQQTKGTLWSVAYVGNNSNSLLNDGSNGAITVDNVNAIHPDGLFRPDPSPTVVVNTIASNGTEVPKVAPNPFLGTTWTPLQLSALAANSTPVTPSTNDWRPYPLYGQLQLEAHTLFANYNGLQATWGKAKGWFTYGANYTWSKALGVRGGYSNGIPGDSFNVRNDYGPLAYDRSDIVNAWYYVDGGMHFHGERIVRYVMNGWAVSGWTGIQSGPNLEATSYSTNFALEGMLGPGAVPGNSGVAGTVQVNNKVFLGTPDVALQPTISCNPGTHTEPHQYINGACFHLPAIGGSNGPFNYPYMHGPGWLDSDLTVFKNIKLNDRQALQLSVAAFNFLNHPLATFSNVNPTEEQLDFLNTVDYDPVKANQVNGTFGTTNFATGRRVMELSAKFTF
ncbi:MAG: carboxypeptidase-like regulatory domain-containing protein [Terracidiphilus sp.]